MKLINGMKDQVQKWIKAVVKWAVEQVDKGKKKSSGATGWLKTGAVLLAVVAAVLLVVGLISAFVVFVLSLPGILFGTILWTGWTWAGLGKQLFPQLDAVWLNLNWMQFFWLTTVVWYGGRVLGIRKKRVVAAQPKS